MNEMKLSKRLERVATYVPKDYKLADIGSDHAYLPSYLCLNGQIKEAIAGEVNEGPFQSAKKQVNRLGIDQQIQVRKGDGLAVISPNEVDVITICGMGGVLISDILDDGKEKLGGVKRLILQPNVQGSRVRHWLKENGWKLVAEEILEEDEKVYEIIVADLGNPLKPYSKEHFNIEVLMGPFLLKERNDAFYKKWNFELANWKRVVKEFEKATETEELIAKKKEFMQLIKEVEEVLS